ncbi:MAG TPA: DNA-processing protein DprA [Candidatus Saccharimonadales bacterium]|nr:DNA-processing protein DprA [Candidatus Saccharimonadales bacterium]
MIVNTLTLDSPLFPNVLRTIATPPNILYIAGSSLEELLQQPCLTVVGSRKVTAYGETVTKQLVGALARAGVVIVSGLAYGIDSIAHRAALDAGGRTIAVLPSGLDSIYPAAHRGLAAKIMQQGGALVSEYPAGTIPYKMNFIARNRITAALGQATLITEAAAKSGTLHTARFALEQGKDVLAVPGNITSPTAVGTNNLIKTGAATVTSAEDIFHVLGIQPQKTNKSLPTGDTPEQETIIQLLATGETDGAVLLAHSQLDIRLFDQSLTMLEITGKVRGLGNNKWTLLS